VTDDRCEAGCGSVGINRGRNKSSEHVGKYIAALQSSSQLKKLYLELRNLHCFQPAAPAASVLVALAPPQR
jgi:hypothetical protein